MIKEDSIIILAWPETPAKAIGMWYDAITNLLGFLKNGYYTAGHAAAVLVNHKLGKLHYFDFGRYHMPQKYGRARDMETDPKLRINTKPIFSVDNKLVNIEAILSELLKNEACHGKGTLYASVLENVYFKSAFSYAKGMQNKNTVPYGPYVFNGTNCSRFISSIAKKSNPKSRTKLNLSSSILFTPLTKANVFACNNVYYKVSKAKISKHRVTIKKLLNNFMLPFSIRSNKTEYYNIPKVQQYA